MSLGASFDIRPDGRAGGVGLGGRGAWQAWIPYLLALGLGLLIHGMVAGTGVTAVLDGQLHGTDGYMRLVRVAALYETGDWFGGTIARDNAPYGTALHWTRPMDLLLLAGAWALSPLLGFEQALGVVQRIEDGNEKVEALSSLALALVHSGELEQARASYERALEINPDFAEAQGSMGAVFLALGELERGLALERKGYGMIDFHVERGVSIDVGG